MEANRAESDRCYEIAQKYFSEGNYEKAKKFLDKASRLCHSDKITELASEIDRLEQMPNGSTPTGDYGAYDHYNTDARYRGSRKEKHADHASSSNEPSSSKQRDRSSTSTDRQRRTSDSHPQQPEFTEQQRQDVLRIRQAKDYYEILGLRKEFTEVELKKSYRRLALQFHPDKNKAPGTAEAFKAIGNAYAVLSDADKRKRYDMYGTADTTPTRRRSGSYDNDYTHGGFEAEFSPEEIFNMFFGGGFPSGTMYTTRGRRTYYYRNSAGGHHHQQQQEAGDDQRNGSSLSVLLQLMPILVLVVLSLFSSFLIGEPAYSLHRSTKYSVERKTSELRVPYYVKADFLKEYGSGSGALANIRRVEQQVEDDYVSNLRSNCFRERSQKETLIWRARTYGDAGMYEKAQQLRTPSCDRLAEIYA